MPEPARVSFATDEGSTMDGNGWRDVFNQICSHREDLLRWGLPEPWVQTELFSRLSQNKLATGWEPIANEIPYVTYFPVYTPRHRDVRSQGAVKWIDLCLVNHQLETFCWMELKVRHTGTSERTTQANKDAQSAIKRDVVALMGMNVDLTRDSWVNPDEFTATHWFKDVLDPLKGKLVGYKHYYTMAYLQLFGSLDESLLGKQALLPEIEKWALKKGKLIGQEPKLPPVEVDLYQQEIANCHSLVLVRWSQ